MAIPTGKLIWLWEASGCEGGDSGKVVTVAKDLSLSGILVKIADGVSPFEPDFARAVCADAFGAGLQVSAWQFLYAAHTPAEEAAKAAELLAEYGVKDLVLDVETEGKDGSFRYRNRDDFAEEYMQAIRSHAPGVTVGLSSYPSVDSHDNMPWDGFLTGAAKCDYVAPQCYAASAGTVLPALRLGLAQFARYGLPICPVTGDWDYAAITDDSVTAFVKAADAAGCPSCSSWWWGAGSPHKGAFGRVKWGAAPTPVPIPVPAPTGYTLVGVDGVPRSGLALWMDKGHGYGRVSEIVEACGCEVTWDKAHRTWHLQRAWPPHVSADGKVVSE